MKTLVDILRPIQLTWNKRNWGIDLTKEEEILLTSYDSITSLSPKNIILANNTSDIKPSEIIEFLNNE